MLPANQCFNPTDHAGAELDLGLVVENQLAARDALAQLEQQLELAGRLFFLGVVGDRVSTACSFGVVHRDVSAPQQLGRGLAVFGKHGDPDAR
jgi:hypothetical protein